VEVVVLFIAILFLAPYWNNHPFDVKENKAADEVQPLLNSVESGSRTDPNANTASINLCVGCHHVAFSHCCRGPFTTFHPTTGRKVSQLL
jgi:hypothetical protein